jgi:hypothetical protein
MSEPTMERLGASADRIALLREELRAEMERRDELVETARDEGASWKVTAAAARMAPSRCAAIIADRGLAA